MRADPDFTAYVAARWMPFVRVLVVLGVPAERADEMAVAAFARIMPDWARLRREGDIDVELARLALDAWVRGRGAEPAPRVAAPVPAGRVLTQELEDQLALLERLTDGLGRMEESTRVTVVLRHLGELEVDQVSEVLGESPREVSRRLTEASYALDLGPLDPACHAAAVAIDVVPPSVDRVLSRASGTRRRQWIVTGAVVAALALVAGVVYVVNRPPPLPPTLDALEVTSVVNPVGVAWWLDGTLHLDHGTARVPDIAQMAVAGFGIAYADTDGDVVSVTEDGTRERIGSIDRDTALVAQVGQVAWLEPEGGDLVVWSFVTKHVMWRQPRTADTRLIGWDRYSLYYRQDDADHSLSFIDVERPTTLDVRPVEGLEDSQLVDVSAGVELRRQDGQLSVTLPFFSVTTVVPGVSGALSNDGNWVLTVDDAGVPMVYDTRDGSQQGPWFRDAWSPVGASFTSDGRVVWIVDEHNGSYGLVDCQVQKEVNRAFDPNNRHCERQLDVGAVPVLAGIRPGLVPTSS